MICGKVIYASRTEATLVIKGANRDRRPGETPNRLNTSYFCEACQGWHIASKCKRKARKGRTTEVETSPVELRRKKDKARDGFLIIRNYSSKPI